MKDPASIAKIMNDRTRGIGRNDRRPLGRWDASGPAGRGVESDRRRRDGPLGGEAV